MCRRCVKSSPHCSGGRVNMAKSVSSRIKKVIADEMVMAGEEDISVEIMQAVETRKEKSAPPKWIWDPSIQIRVVPRRGIIGDDRRTFIIVIIVYDRWFHLRLIFSILTRAARCNRQPKLGSQSLKRFQCIIFSYRQFAGISSSGNCIL